MRQGNDVTMTPMTSASLLSAYGWFPASISSVWDVSQNRPKTSRDLRSHDRGGEITLQADVWRFPLSGKSNKTVSVLLGVKYCTLRKWEAISTWSGLFELATWTFGDLGYNFSSFFLYKIEFVT